MDIVVDVLGLGLLLAFCVGCLWLARRLGPVRDGRARRGEHDAARTQGYEALDQTRRLGGGSGF